VQFKQRVTKQHFHMIRKPAHLLLLLLLLSLPLLHMSLLLLLLLLLPVRA
jgi:hypothetical protein